MMTVRFALLWIVCLLLPASAAADEFLGVPLVPEGRILVKTDDRLQMQTPLSHDEVVDFYRNALRDQKDIKFREWKDDTYIEDDGSRDWHSITVSKGHSGGPIRITIIKDNWTWIVGTLLLRFVGVFVVLLILFAAMSLAGGLISRSVRKRAEQEKPA